MAVLHGYDNKYSSEESLEYVISHQQRPILGKRCPKNQAFYNCRPSCGITCASIYGLKCRTGKACRSGCDCAKGFARLYPDGECVRVGNCPQNNDDRDDHRQRCRGYNEEYTTCGNRCWENCELNLPLCPASCKTGCFCKPGFKRIGGICQDQGLCPERPLNNNTLCTGLNEVFTTNHACNELCVKPLDCSSSQRETRCFCQIGFKRINGVCVDERQCIPFSSTTPTTISTMSTTTPVTTMSTTTPSSTTASSTTPSSTTPSTTTPSTTTTARVCPPDEELMIQAQCREECFLTAQCELQTAESIPRCRCSSGFRRVRGRCVPASRCPCRRNARLHSNNNVCLHDRQCNPNPNTVCGSASAGSYCWCNPGHVLQDGRCVSCSQTFASIEV